MPVGIVSRKNKHMEHNTVLANRWLLTKALCCKATSLVYYLNLYKILYPLFIFFFAVT
jgi:hypothetical protein